ncbi:MAG: 3-deoxy-manno-octulosonate cytidylyltransferase [Elusimicrobiota bacterium]
MKLSADARTLIVIPARLRSTRFPRKVLQLLDGRPIVEWCRRAAVRSRCGPVIVAADHADVRAAVESYGGTAVMTPAGCRSGTDRVFAALRAAEKILGRKFRSIINLQGDEPFIRPATIRQVARLVERGGPDDMSTAVVPAPDPRMAADPNRVKAVLSADGRCLYFSRAPIPHARSRKAPAPLIHIGIYGFTRAALKKFVRLRPSPLENVEMLEQLRALEAGMTIRGARVRDEILAIDTPADLARAKQYLRRIKGKRT